LSNLRQINTGYRATFRKGDANYENKQERLFHDRPAHFIRNYADIRHACAGKCSESPDGLVSDLGDGIQVNKPGPPLKGFWLKLTEEQRQELRAILKPLKDGGASKEEIKAKLVE
jgi:hypothetical protein